MIPRVVHNTEVKNRRKEKGKKKGPIPIAPLQPSTLAAFRPGGVDGAGRGDLPRQDQNSGLHYLVGMKIPMQSLQQGAAAGVILVVLKLVAYLLGIEATSGKFGFGQLVLVVHTCLHHGAQGCSRCIHVWRSIVAALVAAATTTFLGLGMDVVLGSIIDPELSSKMMEFTMQEFEASGVFKMVPEDQEACSPM